MPSARRSFFVNAWAESYPSTIPERAQFALPAADAYFKKLAEAAVRQTQQSVRYDPAYVKIAYPKGDVSQDRGVCADVIIRAYRELGTDLQVLVHEDMAANFSLYPRIWHLRRPDTNIDHRRVPNLMTYFRRVGSSQHISRTAGDYRSGDIVAWDLGGGITHIGIVVRSDELTAGKPMVVHNIGAGPKLEDVLFNWKILGVFRYQPKASLS